MNKTLIISLLCGLLCSCSSLQTGLVSGSASSAKIQLPYYLPKGFITIDVLYKPPIRLKVTTTTESNGPCGSIKKTETKEEVSPPDNKWVADITASVTYVADEKAPRLYAQYTNNIFSKDTIDIKTDEDGLLTTAEGKSEDKSLIVIENLALAALEVGKLIYGVRAPVIGEALKPQKPEDIHITFDPTDQCELFMANCMLLKVGLEIREGLKLDKNNEASYKKIDVFFDGDRKYSGLLFRPLRFYRLYQVKKRECTEEEKTECKKKEKEIVAKEKEEKLIKSFPVPDPDQHYCVPLMRRAFVASITKLEIEKGMLKGLHIEKGSEAEAISGLPLRLLKEVVSLPQGILIYQSDQIQAETKLIEAQTNQIKALQALEKARQESQ